MRLRLFPVGSASIGAIFRIDEFPAIISLNEMGQIITQSLEKLPGCYLDDIGGQIIIKAHDDELEVGVNDLEVESGPLLPGDSLRLGVHRFIVSYERTARTHPPAMKIRILN